jgi:hypothetical protein
MTDALTPELALDYLRELSADVVAGAVFGADGAHLSGAEELVEPARALLNAEPDAAEVQVATAEGAVFAARDDRHALVVVCGRFALPSLLRYDLRVVLAELAGRRPDDVGEAA